MICFKNVIPVPVAIKNMDRRNIIPIKLKEERAPFFIAKTTSTRDITMPTIPIRYRNIGNKFI